MASKMPSVAVNPYMQELCMVVEYQGRETSLNNWLSACYLIYYLIFSCLHALPTQVPLT